MANLKKRTDYYKLKIKSLHFELSQKIELTSNYEKDIFLLNEEMNKLKEWNSQYENEIFSLNLRINEKLDEKHKKGIESISLDIFNLHVGNIVIFRKENFGKKKELVAITKADSALLNLKCFGIAENPDKM